MKDQQPLTELAAPSPVLPTPTDPQVGADGLSFGQRVRDLRRSLGLSQSDVAGEELHASYLSLLESGKRRPTPQVVALLAARLGVGEHLLLTGRPSDADRRAELALAFARLALDQGEVATAIEHLRVLQVNEDLSTAARDEVTFLLARAYLRQGELELAVPLLQDLLDRSLAAESQMPAVVVATPLTWLYVQLGSSSRAVEVGLEVLELAKNGGLGGTQDYFRLAANVMTGLSARGDNAYAATWAERLMREAEDAGVRGGQAALYWNAAVIAERRGRVDEALHLCRRAMAHLSELEDSADLARVQVAAAVILLAADPPRTAEALAALERTHELVVHLGSMGDLAEWHWARSRVALLLNDLPVAREQAEAARRTLATRAEPGDLVLVGQVHLALADSLVAAGAPDDAVVELRRAREALSALPAGFATAYDLRALAERLADAGLEDLAREAFGLALDAAGVRDRDAAVRGAAQAQATNSRSRASTELAG